ncbi:MAG: cyclopropane-fatty-acyl-phospholipid synthase family protein [Thermoleophilia bacterium]|nr:cyclopropane-fatty-acyl-phospholipid synthase family protein [Thermoleophilia bacterium]
MFATLDRIFQQLSHDLPDVPFRVQMWDGTERRYGEGQEKFLLSINTAEALSDVLTRGSLGFGEAYMSGGLDVEGDFQALISFSFHPVVQELHLSARDKGRLLAHVVKNRNSQKRSRENVRHHYDLGNDFYRLWLDESMTYSCAYWDDECETLDQAQRAKYDHICRKLHLRAGERLVDVGCGWGGMLAHAAAEYGVEGVGYTLSDEQHAYANQRLKDLGLHPRVRVELADYRDIKGKFDKFVSIGMFEHVGKEYYGVFFEKVHELLVDGGIGLLHTIGKDKDGDTEPWIATYIFPGGYIPTLAQIAQNMGERDLAITDVENLRLHYARTLDAWAAEFEAHEAEIRERLGDSFVRMWRFYLNGSSAGFKWGDSRVFQVTFTNGLRSDLPMTRAYLHAT